MNNRLLDWVSLQRDGRLGGRRLRRRRIEWTLLALVLLTAVATMSWRNTLERVNLAIDDQITGLISRSTSEDIVLVTIDDKSLASIGRWPWRRGFHAALLDKITLAEPKAVGLDLILTEQDPVYAADDLLLANAMQRNGKVVLPLALQDNYGTGQYKPVLPVPILARSAADIGHIHLKLDADSIVRTTYLQEGDGSRWWSHFGVAVLRTGGFALPAELTPPARGPAPLQPNVWLRDHPVQIPFVGAPGQFQRVSYVDVLKGQIPPSTFTHKFVLVGATSAGMGDAYATPQSGNTELMAGVEISANVMNALLQEQRLERASAWQNTVFNSIPVVLGLLAILWLPPTASLLANTVLMLLTLAASWLTARYTGVLLAPAAALLGLLLAYPLWVWRRLKAAMWYLLEEFQRMEIRHDLPPMQPVRSKGDPLERRIGALQNASEQLRNLHRFVSDILSNLPDATVITDPSGRVLMANQAAISYFQPLGIEQPTSHQLADLLHKVDHEDTSGRLSQIAQVAQLTDATQTWTGEAKDAIGRDMLVKSAPCFNTDGMATGWITSLLDISPIRQAERQRDEALRFISHDMRSPQSSILALLELHSMQADAPMPAQTLQRIERHAQKTLYLAEEFVQLARAKSNAYRLEVLNLSELLHEAVDEVWPQAMSRQISFQLHNPDVPAWCEADRGLLIRAIGNLLSNAVKYSPQNTEVRCTIREDQDRWQLSIADTGPGLSPEQQEVLFQHFVRLHPDERSAPRGIGLGLVFVRTVVERHGSQIHLSSEPGRGTTLHFSLAKVPD